MTAFWPILLIRLYSRSRSGIGSGPDRCAALLGNGIQVNLTSGASSGKGKVAQLTIRTTSPEENAARCGLSCRVADARGHTHDRVVRRKSFHQLRLPSTLVMLFGGLPAPTDLPKLVGADGKHAPTDDDQRVMVARRYGFCKARQAGHLRDERGLVKLRVQAALAFAVVAHREDSPIPEQNHRVAVATVKVADGHTCQLGHHVSKAHGALDLCLTAVEPGAQLPLLVAAP
eukprot:CAMPEP_0183574462 /NCGR_PEP_ID=MMETSP0371-20130417/133417_1 /TAXON_ID=268820 /ORGANISM="Peridinium aciculiferum, Strain PAER-2" /LENGTH=229 /DNA_ID=CAMNT_0025784531 /DNA_START=177 /DNA_END=863 /DNA_ORIENTATION=-